MTANFAEELVQVGGTKIQLFKGGAGEPLLLLHGPGGNRGWLRYVQSLADQYTVYLPTHPGFGASERPDWIPPVSSAIIPGSGQLLLGQERGAIYLTMEVFLLTRFLAFSGNGRRESDAYRDLAFEIIPGTVAPGEPEDLNDFEVGPVYPAHE